VALIASDRDCAAAGVFTTNEVIAAPCVVTRKHLEHGRLRGIVVNSGNANACTGEEGERNAIAMAKAAADKIGCDPHEVAADELQEMLEDAADASFNLISVDGDTSTNDTLLILANGASGVAPRGDDLKKFGAAVRGLCETLAREVLADGEGVTKVFEVRVSGAASAEDARRAARTITTSNLVKTAIHGADPNWGRILAAAGRSGAKVDQTKASVHIADVAVFVHGSPRAFDNDAVRRVFEQRDITIGVDLGVGSENAHAWGTDLSAEYVRVNAEYTT